MRQPTWFADGNVRRSQYNVEDGSLATVCHRTTHGRSRGAGFGRQRSLKVFPALARRPRKPRGFFLLVPLRRATVLTLSGDKLDDVGAKPNTLRCRAEAPAVAGFLFFATS